jgi:hypothetical protein
MKLQQIALCKVSPVGSSYTKQDSLNFNFGPFLFSVRRLRLGMMIMVFLTISRGKLVGSVKYCKIIFHIWGFISWSLTPASSIPAAEDCVVPLLLWYTEDPAWCNMVLSSRRNDSR